MSYLIEFYSPELYSNFIVPTFFDAKLEDVLKSNSGKEALHQMFVACLKKENMNPVDLLKLHKFVTEVKNDDFIPEDLEKPTLTRQ
jgi:hypothetical protein